MIYVIGDSHVAFFSKDKSHYEIKPYPETYDSNPQGYKIIRIDIMISAYAVKNNIEKINEILSQYTLTDDDYIIFSFGEIDMRYYLPKDIKEGKDPNITFEKSLSSYEDLLKNVLLKHRHIILFAPVPQVIEEEQLNEETGFLDRKTRDEYTIKFNERLTEMCNKLGIDIIDIREYIIDGDTIKGEYYEDFIHVTKDCMIFVEKELEKIKGGIGDEHN